MQAEERERALREEVYEMSKPLARYADDKDMNDVGCKLKPSGMGR